MRIRKAGDHGRVANAASISERPPEAAYRAVPRYRKRDLVYGRYSSQIATLVGRNARYAMLVRAPNKGTKAAINPLSKQADKLMRELYKSHIWECGKDLPDQGRVRLATDIDMFLCDSQ